MEDAPTVLESVTGSIADVSPSWASVTSQPGSGEETPLRAPLGRDRAFGVELIREGWLVHRGAARTVDGASPDLALLIGDWCYAAGLCAITDHGTLDDVAKLATLVADVSARADESVDALQPYWQETLDSMRHG